MNVGDVVEDFELEDQGGTPTRLSRLLEVGPVVLFFYPAAMTKGCTAEACHFRDLSAEFAQIPAQPVGISADSVDRQQQFAAANDLKFPLLSDPDGNVARQFGVKRRFGPIPVKRHTFVIDPDRKLLAVIRSEFDMQEHADQALAVITNP
jgi:peroxiredoxin Q/BCP